MHGAKKTYDGKIAGLYDLEETLGRGHFAVVKLARHVFTGEKVAVKVIDKTKLDEVSRAHLFQEVRCMKLVQHPNVVRLYEVIDTQTKLYLILELGDGGDLYDYIMKHEGGLEEDMAKEYFRQIVRAISYCHQLHVVHRDLKPENVVFFERLGVVKLTDFGFSNKFCPGQKLDTSCGSLAYSAPEILLGDSYDAPAVDVWSLGVILYMLVAGQAPFQEANDSETLTMIMDCKYTIPKHVSEDCRRLIAKMLVREPEYRATLEDIASDPWLGGCPQVEYLPLVSRHQVTDEDHNMIINRMVNGNIATKEEVLEALDRNEYNHITATYFLLAERKLRTYRQEEAQNKLKQNSTSVGIATAAKNSLGKAHSADSASSDTLQIPQLGFGLKVPLNPAEVTLQGKVRKCSIVQEEEDEEEYCSVVGSSQELTPPHSSLNRRGSRSEGKLNIAVQERICEERRKDKKESPGQSPRPSNVGRVIVKDDVSWPNKRTSPTAIHPGIPAAHIPTCATRRVCAGKTGSAQNSPLDSKGMRFDGSMRVDSRNASGDFATNSVDVKEWKSVEMKTREIGDKGKIAGSSQLKSPSAKSEGEARERNSDIASEISLKDSATFPIPNRLLPNGSSSVPKYKTMPSPTRTCVKNSVLGAAFEGIPELTMAASESSSGENRPNRKGIPSINYEQRKSKFRKSRTTSCSSSDASDDDSESRKKRAHKISMEKNNRRRDSHDDGRDRGGNGEGGSGGNNTASGLGSGGDGMHNQDGGGSGGGAEGKESAGSGDHSAGGGSGNNQRQCNGEGFRRSRRRMGETRLRESQSLNRIVEVQESDAGNYSASGGRGTAEVAIRERSKKGEVEGKRNSSNGCDSIGGGEKNKLGKSLGARFLQSWSNTLSTTKLSVQRRKFSAEGGKSSNRGAAGEEIGKSERLTEQLPKNYSEEKENKALIEKTGQKMKALGRYFQVSKKLSIPIPSLSSSKDGRLYKARSCGSISKDRVAIPAATSGTATLEPAANGVALVIAGGNKNGKRGDVFFRRRERSKSPRFTVANQSLDPNGNSDSTMKVKKKKPPIGSWKEKGSDGGSVGAGGESENAKGDVNENLTGNAIGAYNCPNFGICQMHMRDAAKCHLS